MLTLNFVSAKVQTTISAAMQPTPAASQPRFSLSRMLVLTEFFKKICPNASIIDEHKTKKIPMI